RNVQRGFGQGALARSADGALMSDDQQALADQLDRLATDAARLAARVRQLDRGGDALDDLRNGGVPTPPPAPPLCGVSDQAIRDWIEHAASIGQPIAEKLTTWIISTRRLLAYIEAHCGGRPARVKAENLWKECWPRWSHLANRDELGMAPSSLLSR